MQSFQGNLVDNNYVESLITADLIDAVVAGYYPSQIIYLNPGQSVNLQMSFRNVANRVWSPSIFGISTFFFALGYGSTFSPLTTTIGYNGTAGYSLTFTAPTPKDCGAADSYPLSGNMAHSLNGALCTFGDGGNMTVKVSRECEPGEEPCDIKICSICFPIQFLSASLKKDLDTVRQFRDEVLMRGEGGALFTYLYYEFSPEISEIIRAHPDILWQSVDLIRTHLPLVKALVNGNGELPPGLAQKVLSDEELRNIELFIDAIHQYAGPELREFLDMIRDLLHEFGKIPLGIGLKTLIHGTIIPEKAQGKAWGIIKMIETVPGP